MAIVLDDKDPVFGGAAQKQGLPKSPAPAPAPAPAAVYDYQQFSDPYTAVPDSQGYDSPVPGTIESSPYWVNDPTLSVSGGGYTLDPATGQVWIEAQGRWGSLDELRNLQYGAGTGMYGEYVEPGGVPTPAPAPGAVERLAPEFLDFATEQFAPPAPAPVEIQNQVTGLVLPWEPDPTMQNPDTQIPYAEADFTPSSRANPNITSGGNVWDDTLQTWIDPSGKLWDPRIEDWITRADYIRMITGGNRYENPFDAAKEFVGSSAPFLDDLLPDFLSSFDDDPQGTKTPGFELLDNALARTISGERGAYIDVGGFDPLGVFPGSEVYDLPPVTAVDTSALPKLYDIADEMDKQYRANVFSAEAQGVLNNLPTVREGQSPDAVLTPGVATYYYQEERNPVTGELETILYRWDGSASGRAAAQFGQSGMISELLFSSPWEMDAFKPVRDKLPNWVNEAIEGSISPVGLATLLVPVAGVGGRVATIGANVAQNFIYGAAYGAAREAGASEELAMSIGLVASAGSEAALSKTLAVKGLSNAGDNLIANPPNGLSWDIATDSRMVLIPETGNRQIRLLPKSGAVKAISNTGDESSISLLDTTAGGRVVSIAADAAEPPPVIAVRPTSLKAGDKVLLSNAEQGAEFGTKQGYSVVSDAPAVTPGSRISIKDADGRVYEVEASRLWKVGDTDLPSDVVFLNNGIPLTAIDDSATAIWGAVNRIAIRGVEANTGPRAGILLHPAGIDNLGKDFTAAQFDKMAGQLLKNELPNQVQGLQDAYNFYKRGLGRLSKTDMMMDVGPSDLERSLGLAHPFAEDVIENPGNYKLTAKQLESVLNIAALNKAKMDEQIFRGVEDRFLPVGDGRNYMPRVAKFRKGEEFPKNYTANVPAAQGMFTRSAHDRVWETKAEAVVKGSILYKRMDESFLEHSRASLQRAAYKHLNNTMAARGIKPADLVDPTLTKKFDNIKKMVLSLGAKMSTAEKRANVYDRLLDDVGRIYEDVMVMKPEGPTSKLRYLPGRIEKELQRAEKLAARSWDDSLDSMKQAQEWVKTSRENVTLFASTLRGDISNLERAATRAGSNKEHFEATVRTARKLFDQAESISTRIKDAEAQIARLKSAKGVSRATRSEINREVRNLRRKLDRLGRIEVGATGAASKIDRADAGDVFAKLDNLDARARVKQTVSSLRDVADERSGAELARAISRIDEMIPEGLERLDFYDTFVANVERRIARLSEAGDRWSSDAQRLVGELEQAKVLRDQYREILNAQVKAKRTDLTLAGKVTFPGGQFPSLRDVYVDPDIAKALTKHFRGEPQTFLRILGAPSRLLTPFLVTWDLSVYMTMLGKSYTSLALKKPSRVIPTATAQFGEGGMALLNKVFRNKLNNPFDYLKWSTSDRVMYARRFVPLRGEDTPDELLFLRAFQRVPGVAESQKHFTRTWNRATVELFYAELDSLRASGKVLSDADMEAVGRAVARIAGIPWNKAAEVERTYNFAADFFRSRLETHYYALAKGGIEGNLARQHLLTYYSAMAAIAGGVALEQGRNPFEVLSPIDLDALANGEFRFNSNFMTVRVAGGDLNLVPDRALLTLLWTVVEAPTLAAIDRDPSRIWSALYYINSIRANPQFKVIGDLFVGHTFSGDPFLSWESLHQRLLPIFAQNVFDNMDDSGLTWQDQVGQAAFAVLGASINPMTGWERRDSYIRQMEMFSGESGKQFLLNKNRPASYNNLNRAGKLLVDKEYGEVPGKSWDSRVRSTKRAVIDQDTLDQLRANDAAWLRGDKTLVQWKRDRDVIFAGDRKAKEILYGEYDQTDNRDPVDQYFAKLHEMEQPDGSIDWDGLESWMRSQPKDARDMIEKYLGDTRKIYGSPVVDRDRAVSKALSDLGFYETRDSSFAAWAADMGLPAGTTLESWKSGLVEAEVNAYAATLEGMPADARTKMLNNYRETMWEKVNNLGAEGATVEDWNNHWYESYLRDFIGSNPELALEADTFQKLTIRKDEKDIIQSIGIGDEEALKAAIASERRAESFIELPDQWKQAAWDTFTYPSELGIERKDTYTETRQAWIASYHGKESYSELTKAQQTTGGAAWDDLLGNNADSWFVVERQSRITGFLNTWDALETDEEREAFLALAISGKDSFSWVHNKSDATLLYRASQARGGAFDKLFTEAGLDWVGTYKVDSSKYIGSGEAILWPSSK